MVEREATLPSRAAATPMKTPATTCPPRKPTAAKRSHIHAERRSRGAAPTASCSPSDPLVRDAGATAGAGAGLGAAVGVEGGPPGGGWRVAEESAQGGGGGGGG